VILNDSLVCVPHDSALRCEKSFLRGSSSDVWLSISPGVVRVVVNGVVACSFLSPCRSFNSFPLPTSLIGIESVAVFVLVEVVVLAVVVVVIVVVVDVVVVAVVVVVVVVVVLAVVVVVIVVVRAFLNFIVDIVDLDIFGRGKASVDIMLFVVEVFAVDVLVGVSSPASTTSRGSRIATLQHTRGRESLKPQWFEKISLLASAPPVPLFTCFRISSSRGHSVMRTHVVPGAQPESSGIRWN